MKTISVIPMTLKKKRIINALKSHGLSYKIELDNESERIKMASKTWEVIRKEI